LNNGTVDRKYNKPIPSIELQLKGNNSSRTRNVVKHNPREATLPALEITFYINLAKITFTHENIC